MSNPADDGSSTPQHPDGQYGQQNPYGAAPAPDFGPQSQPDAGDVPAGSAWSQPKPPADPYAQQPAQDPWAAPPAQDPAPQQPVQDPWAAPADQGQPSAQDPYGQPSAQDPFGQPSVPEDPVGQPSAQDPYGQSSAPDPFAPSGASPYGAPPVDGLAPAGAGAAPGQQGQSRLLVGLLGIFVGGWGVHRFLMGYTTIGIIQIVVTLVTCGFGALWGLVEGIMVLARSEQFQRDAHGRPLAD